MTVVTHSIDSDAVATDIAVIGMACRFPGAGNPTEFWSLLSESREARCVLSDNELRAAGVPEVLIRDPAYVKGGMFLQDMEQFDPAFFGFSPFDARLLDPQHRQFLECTWETLEDAGYDPSRYTGSIGIFAGSGHNAYLPFNLLSNPQLVADVGFFLLRHTGNDKDFLTTRASYCFDLKGPSINVQTACSTSLVAVHCAIQSLLGGECDMALAGGVTIELPHRQGYLCKEGEILSPDGHCRPFDASAGGTVFGSGVGLVMLKRLEYALKDRDNIRAVIKASAVNNDGAGKISYLAPSVDGQAAAIREALSVAGIEPDSVTYLETHGTGTKLGDPIEIAALAEAYGGSGTRKQYCSLGSVKSNIGHLDTAAGAASLIKVILSLEKRQIPATLHFTRPNPAIDFAATPFYVNSTLRRWDAPSPLRGGVSSLGVGGTNAHLIVEEPPRRMPGTEDRRSQLLLLSARTPSSLSACRLRLARHLHGEGRRQDLADIAYTLFAGRRHFRRRIAVVAMDHEAAAELLEGSRNKTPPETEAPEKERAVAFMFAGGGAQYPNMGLGLYRAEPAYRDTVDECLRLVSEFIDFDLRTLLYPPEGQERQAAEELQRPSRSLPALFVTQYAQACLWRSWGVMPGAMIGHSMGENTAACVAGVLSLRDALGLVALRGRLFETLPAGGMLSINLSAEDLAPLLKDGLGFAARNASELTVVSGPQAALAELEAEMVRREVTFQRVRINVAAHSAMLEPILEPFGRYLRAISLQTPSLPFLSNLTGDWISPEQARDPDYWVRHLRQTVRFEAGIGRLLDADGYALLEVGPGRTLSSLAAMHGGKRADQAIVTSMRHADDAAPDQDFMLAALGRLWQANASIEWSAFRPDEQRCRVSLPTYAFDHTRCWIDPGVQATLPAVERNLPEDWFYVPIWVPQPSAVRPEREGAACLIGSQREIADLRSPLSERFETLIEVVVARNFEQRSALEYSLGSSAEDYSRLLQALAASGHERIRLFLATAMAPLEDVADNARSQLLHLLNLGRAMAEVNCDIASLLLLSRGAARVAGDASLPNPGAACLSGAMGPLASEMQLAVSMVDLGPAPSARDLELLVAEQPEGECALLAYRHGQRLKLQFQRIHLPLPECPRLRESGVYLITGGLGGLGMTLAKHLAASKPVKIALLTKRAIPPTGALEFYVAGGGDWAGVMDSLESLRRSGSEVLLLQADVADRAALTEAVEAVERQWGQINGVFHTAGVLADALVPLQTPGLIDAVLAPKVEGTINLDDILAERQLDFMMLYSSTSVSEGIPGQAVYAAANAFMDGFAQSRAAAGRSIMAVNWAAWREVGMTEALRRPRPIHRGPIPAGGRCNVAGNRYRRVLDGSDWVVAEHRTRRGVALLPGTGFIELACQAGAAVLTGSSTVGVRDLRLLTPLLLSAEERAVVSVVFEPDGRFIIYSSRDAESADRGDWLAEHARGQAFGSANARRCLDIPELDRRCATVRTPANGRVVHQQMDFGERWHCVRSIGYGDREAVVRLQLGPEFNQDLEQHPLHPALLDMATGAASELVAGLDPASQFLVPQAYGNVTCHAPLTGELVSHITRSSDSTADSPVLDICITDTAGTILLEIAEFKLIRLGSDALDRLSPRDKARTPPSALEALLANAIRPEEGMEAIERLLANPGIAQLLVSPMPPKPLWLHLEPGVQPEPGQQPPTDTSDRKGISAVYEPPSTELEKKLAQLWQEGLGVDAVGINDNFFELGGHSMLMIQLVGRLRKQAGINLALSSLYTNPTITDWIRLAAEGEAAPPLPARPALKRVSREAYRRADGAAQASGEVIP